MKFCKKLKISLLFQRNIYPPTQVEFQFFAEFHVLQKTESNIYMFSKLKFSKKTPVWDPHARKKMENQ